MNYKGPQYRAYPQMRDAPMMEWVLGKWLK